MSCKIQGEDLSALLDGELGGLPERQLRQHVSTCAECREPRSFTGARAVGNACRRNPVPVVIPCHRVVSARGIGGYAGDTGGNLLRIKSWLLQHEGSAIN